MAREETPQGFRSLIEQIQPRDLDTPPVTRAPSRRPSRPRPAEATETTEKPAATAREPVRLLARRWL
jgi:hypothetical protein